MILDYTNYITETASQGLVNYSYISENGKLFNHDSMCPFCKKQIKNQVYNKSKQSYPEWLFGSFDELENVVQCPTCGWWEYKYSNRSDAVLDGIRASDIQYSSAIIREYDDNSVEVPVEALRSYIEKHPDILYKIDAHKMEDLVRSVFSDFYPSCQVKAFGKTRDGGKDGVLIDDNGEQTLIQIKRRTSASATEGVDALRALIGASIIEDNTKGCIFVTTAHHFSAPAKQYAEKVLEKQIVETFDLVDCKEFISRLNLVSNKLPNAWNELLHLK